MYGFRHLTASKPYMIAVFLCIAHLHTIKEHINIKWIALYIRPVCIVVSIWCG